MCVLGVRVSGGRVRAAGDPGGSRIESSRAKTYASLPLGPPFSQTTRVLGETPTAT